MHELSLMEGIIALVEDERRTQYFSCVRLIRLRAGLLGYAEADALRFCFDAAAEGTIAAGATLEIDLVPGTGECPACRQLVPLTDRLALCPLCEYAGVHVISGDELQLVEMEVD